MGKQFEVTLDLYTENEPRPLFEVIDGDTGNVLTIHLTDNGNPIDIIGLGYVPFIVFNKPDGIAVQCEPENMEIVDNSITIPIYRGAVSPTLVRCEVQLYDGVLTDEHTTLVTTTRFSFNCNPALLSPKQTGKLPQVSALQEIIMNAQKELDDFITDSQNALSEFDNDSKQALDDFKLNAQQAIDKALLAAKAAEDAAKLASDEAGKAGTAAYNANQATQAANNAAQSANQAANAANTAAQYIYDYISTLSPASIGALPDDVTVNGKLVKNNPVLVSADVGAIPTSQKGIPFGVATLGVDGKVVQSQLGSGDIGGITLAAEISAKIDTPWSDPELPQLLTQKIGNHILQENLAETPNIIRNITVSNGVFEFYSPAAGAYIPTSYIQEAWVETVDNSKNPAERSVARYYRIIGLSYDPFAFGTIKDWTEIPLSQRPVPTPEEIGAISDTATVNGKLVKNNPTITAEDIGAADKATFDSSILMSDVSCYVDIISGNDTTGDGSSANPWKTIQKAVDSTPKNLNGNYVTIYIVAVGKASGLQDVTIANHFGGMFIVSFWSMTTADLSDFQVALNVHNSVVTLRHSAAYDSGFSFSQIAIRGESARLQTQGPGFPEQHSYLRLKRAGYHEAIILQSGAILKTGGVTVTGSEFGQAYDYGVLCESSSMANIGEVDITADVSLQANSGGIISYGKEITKGVHIEEDGGRIFTGAQNPPALPIPNLKPSVRESRIFQTTVSQDATVGSNYITLTGLTLNQKTILRYGGTKVGVSTSNPYNKRVFTLRANNPLEDIGGGTYKLWVVETFTLTDVPKNEDILTAEMQVRFFSATLLSDAGPTDRILLQAYGKSRGVPRQRYGHPQPAVPFPEDWARSAWSEFPALRWDISGAKKGDVILLCSVDDFMAFRRFEIARAPKPGEGEIEKYQFGNPGLSNTNLKKGMGINFVVARQGKWTERQIQQWERGTDTIPIGLSFIQDGTGSAGKIRVKMGY